MKRRTRRRKSAAGIAAALVTFTLGVTLAVVVTGSASASSPLTTSTTTSTTSSSATTPMSPGLGLDPKAGRFAVINGTVSAASDHAIVASSAFPNYTTGAVDNYYSLARSHLDNSPFGEGTASPADTGPVGQTAAAGNFQQSQYADARWPGGPDTATFGSEGAPYADATAADYLALANASQPSRALAGPKLPVPQGFDSKLQQALAQWKKKWESVLGSKPAAPSVTPPKTVSTPVATVTTPKPSAPAAPTATVTTPIATVATPKLSQSPAAPAPAPAPAPSVPTASAAGPSRSMASASDSSPDGESLLTSSTQAALVPITGASKTGIPAIDTTPDKTAKTDTTKTVTDPAKLKPYALVLRGESSLGRVSLGGGQILIRGIHVKAAIGNDGTSPTPAYEASVSVGDASIAGVPVTIDQDGVHVAGHTQGVPYGKISDSLNGALKQAGIQLFLVAPQVTTSSCGQPGTGTDTTNTTTTTTSTDQSGATSSCGTCPPPGTGTDTTSTSTTTTTATTSNPSYTTPPPGSCDQTGAGAGCDQSGTSSGTTTTGTTTTTPLPGTPTPTSTTTSTSTSTTPSSSDCAPPSSTSSCTTGTATGSKTTSGTQTTSGTPPPPPMSDPMSPMGAGSAGNEETVNATGLHVVFTQPVSPPGVPAQYVEHILGQVFVDSLASLAPPLPKLGLSPFSTSSSAACGGRHSRVGTKSGGSASTAGGGSSAGGSALSGAGGSGGSGSLSASGSSLGSGSQLASGSTPGSSSGGGSFPASVVRALKKPLWLLLAYLVWQVLVIGTGASLWHWRKGGAA